MTAIAVSAARRSDARQLMDTVVEGGYCLGCGGCAAVKNSPIRMSLNEYGMYQPAVADGDGDTGAAQLRVVCPFSDESSDEDRIGAELFAADAQYTDKIGYHIGVYAGHVVEGEFRARGSSGGITNWLAAELLRLGKVDGVIHVGPLSNVRKPRILYGYRISTTLPELTARAKSRYYPVEISGVIGELRRKSGRYAFIGVPSLVKAVRLLCRQDSDLDDRIAYCIALFCGQMKSTRFSDMLGWKTGIRPGNLISIDFRRKLEGMPADRFGVEMEGLQDGRKVRRLEKNHDLFQDPWGLGFFKYNACDFCDDVVGETADVSLGDAWIPRYAADGGGANEVIVRNREIDGIIQSAISQGRLHLEPLDITELIDSQGGAFRHRRDGLAYRLLETDRAGRWRPRKRVQPGEKHLTRRLKFIHEMRVAMAQKSHRAFDDAVRSGNYRDFEAQMEPLVRKYEGTRARQIASRVKARLKRILPTLAGRIVLRAPSGKG